MRAIVEGKHHRLGRQVAAEHFAVAVARGERVRLYHAMVAQDVLARVQRAQMRHIVVPFLALGHDGAAAVETTEDLRQLLVVATLDLVQRLQILADALMQFHRRQCRVAADARM